MKIKEKKKHKKFMFLTQLISSDYIHQQKRYLGMPSTVLQNLTVFYECGKKGSNKKKKKLFACNLKDPFNKNQNLIKG